jgi:hypothetical protein
MRQVDRFLDCLADGHDAHMHLAFARQPNSGNEARAEIDHSAIDAGDVGVRVEHRDMIGEDMEKMRGGLRSERTGVIDASLCYFLSQITL